MALEVTEKTVLTVEEAKKNYDEIRREILETGRPFLLRHRNAVRAVLKSFEYEQFSRSIENSAFVDNMGTLIDAAYRGNGNGNKSVIKIVDEGSEDALLLREAREEEIERSDHIDRLTDGLTERQIACALKMFHDFEKLPAEERCKILQIMEEGKGAKIRGVF
jgi:hypothetical protein